MDPMEAIRATFFEECAELMENLEAGLLALQAGTQDPDTVDAVFRAVHSIKGGAGAFDLGVLVGFAHEFETSLDALRSGRLTADDAVIAVFLRASDQLGDLVSASRDGVEIDAPDTSDIKALLDGLGGDDATGHDAEVGFAPVMLDFGLDPIPDDDEPTNEADHVAIPIAITDAVAPERRVWDILFEPLPELLTSGNEPLFLFRALEVLGQIEVEAIDADLPPLAEMEPNVARLRWNIRLSPSAPDLTETEIESIFEFAVDLCVLEIEAGSAAPGSGETVPSVDAGVETRPADPSPAPIEISPTPAAAPPANAEAPPAPPAKPADSAPADKTQAAAAPPVSATIRVDLARVDRLVNLVGELVISQSMLAQGMARAGLDQHSDAVANLDELQQLTRDMQDSVMSIRAQPVKSLFQRMTRIVREASQATNKDVRLVTEGEGTEIDKTVVERLADPLTHMIRNAIDHGLEDREQRSTTSKDKTGIVRLSARQQSDRVVIEVGDDGRGINRAKVLERAIDRGLVPEGKVLAEAEIDRLLFMPGFSTSTEVSALSGRGVGMDVVQRAIRDLNGTIAVYSVEGEGCTISISLPLTLAILDGMIVFSNRQRMVIPLSAILETQTLSAARVEILSAGQKVVMLHDRFVPLIDLAEGMGFEVADTPDASMAADDDTALIFVKPDDSGTFALRVDAIEAQRQVVIKGLGDNFGHVPCVSAATILGDGQVALIVDPAGIAAMIGLQHAAAGPRQSGEVAS